MQLSLIFLGFLAGMSHALEPDHLAAIGALSAGKTSRGELVSRGAAWGLGHTITLFLICSAAILFGLILSDRMSAVLESAVGVMLILLGGAVLIRLRRAKLHFHAHEHAGGTRHFHAHSHLGDGAPHGASSHVHKHHAAFPFKALGVGLVHGAAGSGALLALAIVSVSDPWLACLYVLLFGLGSIAGMALLSLIISWPLKFAEHVAGGISNSLTVAIGMLGVGMGANVIFSNFPIVWGGT